MTAQLLDRLPPPVRRALRYDLPALLELRRGEAELRILPELLGDRGGIVDVGANTGIYSVLTHLLGRPVTAFEPHPAPAAELRSALRDGGIVHEVCLSDSLGEARFFIPQTASGADISTRGSLEASAHPDLASREITVPTRPLDEYGFDDIALLKIDVEGHEWPVLQNATDTIRRAQPIVLVEIEEHRAPGNLDRITEFMTDLDYSGHFLHHRTLCPLRDFDPTRNQRPEDVPAYGVPRSADYINNFIWLPTSRPVDAFTRAAGRSAASATAFFASRALVPQLR